MKKAFPVLGYDIGGTKIGISLGTSDGEILVSKRISSKDLPASEALPLMATLGREALASTGLATSDLRAVGIAAPSPMDVPNGLILNPPNNVGWESVPIRDFFSAQFGAETFLENDANAGALAEWMFGAGKGSKNMIYLTMSTGVGGGLIVNGRLARGAGFLGGELGHVIIDIDGPLCGCGLRGCYEAFCGGRNVAERVKRELADQPLDHPVIQAAGGCLENIDFIALEKAVRVGDPYAAKVWDDVCRRHAQAIGGFINALNPELIVLGTIAWAAGDLFMKPLLEYLPRFCWKETLACCEIVTSALRRNIADYAGICAALNYLYERGDYAPVGKPAAAR